MIAAQSAGLYETEFIRQQAWAFIFLLFQKREQTAPADVGPVRESFGGIGMGVPVWCQCELPHWFLHRQMQDLQSHPGNTKGNTRC